MFFLTVPVPLNLTLTNIQNLVGEERNRVNILYDVKSPNIVKGKIKHYSDKLKLKEKWGR